VKQGFKTIDTDLHLIEPTDLWDRRLEEPYRSRTRITFRAGGHLEVSGYQFDLNGISWSPAQGFVMKQSMRRWEEHPHLAQAHLNCNPQLYLEGMDTEGIDIAVLVPTIGFLITTVDGIEPDHALALCRVYNDWASEFASEAPDRFRFWGWLPRQSADLAAEEARRCVQDLGAAGVAITSGAVDGRLLSDPFFEPLWQAIDHLDVPLGIHLYGSAPAMNDDLGRRYHGQPRADAAFATMNGIFHAMTSVPELITAGVLERYPRVRPMLMEVGSSWLLWLLERMDGMWEMYAPDADVRLPLAPSEYFRRQCYVAVECDEDAVQHLVDHGLRDNLVFTTDYPHHDSPYPEGVSTFVAQALSDEDKQKILWDNATALFRRNFASSPVS
jgi:uncharacterized protein